MDTNTTIIASTILIAFGYAILYWMPERASRNAQLSAAIIEELGAGELPAYQLIKRLRVKHPTLMKAAIGKPFVVLHELEKQGEIVSRIEDQGGRTRRIYALKEAHHEH